MTEHTIIFDEEAGEMKQIEVEEEESEEEELSAVEELEQLKADYKFAKSAAENRKMESDNPHWASVAEDAREELIDAYEGRIEELQSYSDSLGMGTVSDVDERKQVEELVENYEAEIEELSQ